MFNPFRKLLSALPHLTPQLTAFETTTTSSPGGYDAATISRRMGTWGLSTFGPNTALYAGLYNTRQRARKLRNDNPWADNGIESQTSNLIGRGITPRWRTGDKELNKEIKELWDESMLEIDINGVSDVYGLQALGTTAFIESGEVFGQFIYTQPGRTLVPLKLKLLESDYLDETRVETLSESRSIKMGIELTAAGERLAYHFYKNNPNEAILGDYDTTTTVRVPADNVLHIYKPLRPGQLRGRPWLTSLITRLYQLDEYEDSELKRKAIASFFAGFVMAPESENDDIDLPGEEALYNGEDVINLEPGTIQYLRKGAEKIEFANPVDVGQTYEPWVRQNLRAIAAGMGITYEQLTGDLTGVNYTSLRAGLIEFRRRCRMTQRNIIIFQFCRPFAIKWLDTAVLNGAIQIPDYWQNRRKYIRVLWDTDGWDFTDPVKDLQGKKLAMRNGLSSRAKEVGEMGHDVEQLDQEINEDNQRSDSLGLVFDSDPRKTNSTGADIKSEGE